MKINLYLENRDNLIKTENIDENITSLNLDVVRSRVIEYLQKENILDIKYKVSLNSFNNTSEIDIIFENNISLLRELKLKKIFND